MMTNRLKTPFVPIVLAALAWGAAPAAAQLPAEPPPPARYKTTLRYEITAGRDIHVAKYDALIAHLKGLGFEFVPKFEKLPETDREDPGKNVITGFLPSKSLTKVFDNPHVASLLVVPEGLDLPADGAVPMRVRLEIAGGLPLDRQHELLEQTRAVLYETGFRELLGYDQRGYSKQPFTRLVGLIPTGSLPTLLRDLRTYPFGWFFPAVRPEDVPAPLSTRHPILITEVLPPTDLIHPFMDDKDAIPPEGFEKIDNEMWKAIGPAIKEEKRTGENVRVEIFLAGVPSLTTPPSAAPLRSAAPSLFVIGQVGQLVTAVVDSGQIAALARLPQVILVRFPRQPYGPVNPAVESADAREAVLKMTGIADLHAKGLKGMSTKGKKKERVRLAVVDRDFRGWSGMVKAGKLNAATRMVDLTRPADPEFVPIPEPGDPAALGHGTQSALVAALAAPEAELILVRIPGNSIHELIEVGRYFRGEIATPLLVALQDKLSTEEGNLLLQRKIILEERKEILDRFRDDTDDKREFGYLGPVYGWVFSDRWWNYGRVEYQEKLEREHQDRQRRFRLLLSDIISLSDAQIAVCSLNWPTGYPLGGVGPVVRWFNENGRKGPLWFQAAGNTRGQAWSGAFRDEDGNGVLEFAPRSTPLKPGRWTHELAFLRWSPWQAGLETPDAIPVRVSLQWRETHDTDYYQNPEAMRPEEVDPFAKPQARVDVLLLKQVDPEGKTVGADTFELIARNAAPAVRLEYQPGTAVYETSFVATLDPKSNYAVRVLSPSPSFWALLDVDGRPVYLPLQRRNSRSTRPGFAPSLPDLEQRWELHPRLFIETLDAPALHGRMLFADYATDAGTLGTPAEASGVFAVGAVDLKGKPRPYSAEGPPAFADLGQGPALYAPDELHVAPKGQAGAFGTTLSAPLAAGWVAAASSDGFARERVAAWLRTWRGRTIGAR